MDAIKYVTERTRMCRSMGCCDECPAYIDGDCYVGGVAELKNPKEQVRVVEEWSVAHPIKTRQTEFLKQWPETCLDRNGAIAIEPCTLSKAYQDANCDQNDCAECRKDFWLQGVK